MISKGVGFYSRLGLYSSQYGKQIKVLDTLHSTSQCAERILNKITNPFNKTYTG